MVRAATQVIISQLEGKPSPVPEMKHRPISHYGVKEAVMPFNMFQEVDPVLGPEMRSTGEVLGLSTTSAKPSTKRRRPPACVCPWKAPF